MQYFTTQNKSRKNTNASYLHAPMPFVLLGGLIMFNESSDFRRTNY